MRTCAIRSVRTRRSSTLTPSIRPTKLRLAGRWLPRGQRCALPATSGRDRLNLHGAIDLETGQTRIMDVETVDAQSTIALFEALERAHSTMSRIDVFLDNARYHHAKAVQGWLQQPGRRIVLHFGAVILSASQPDRAAVEGDARRTSPTTDATPNSAIFSSSAPTKAAKSRAPRASRWGASRDSPRIKCNKRGSVSPRARKPATLPRATGSASARFPGSHLNDEAPPSK